MRVGKRLTLLLKYSISFHLIPSCAYSSWGDDGEFNQSSYSLSPSSNLFRLHRQLNEDLLQLFVDKIDAELLEPVLLEYLEPVDVENPDADHLRLGRRVVLHGDVDFLEKFKIVDILFG